MSSRVAPNIVFLVLDTCRADTFFDLLDEGLLPNIERVTGDAKTYRNAVAVGPWTVPSHGSMFSGLYPGDHGSSANDPYFDPPTVPLAERLRRNEYETTALSANPWISPSFNFTTGFDRFKRANELFWDSIDISDIRRLDSRYDQATKLFDKVSISTAPKVLANIMYGRYFSMETDSGARRITNDALRWLSRRSSDTPFFLFCNYIEPHLPYNPPERLLKDELQADVSVTQAREINQDQWRYVAGDADMSQQDFEILQRMYRAEIRYLDSQLGNLFDGIDQEYGLDQTALVLVGDHGENIGDHGLMDHQYCIYQTLLDVPLIVRYPPLFESEDTDTLIETRTLYKTLLDVAGIHDEEDNRIAPSLLDEESMPEYTIAEYAAPQPPVEKLDKQYGPLDQSVREYDRALRSVQNDQWKLIEGSDGLRELYDLQTDPNESTPIHNEEIAQELEEYLATRRGSISELSMDETEPTHASTQQLRDLGYL